MCNQIGPIIYAYSDIVVLCDWQGSQLVVILGPYQIYLQTLCGLATLHLTHVISFISRFA